MQITTKPYPLPVSHRFINLLDKETQRSCWKAESGLVLHFRDPSYSAEKGGFHPVEIGLNQDHRLLYVTDFTYVGQEPFIELAKDLDFDFVYQVFQQNGRDYPIEEGKALFALWQRNFISYYRMGVYGVSVEVM